MTVYTTSWRRPSEAQSSCADEPFSTTTGQGSQPVAAPLSACPVTSRRPRDLDAFQAACAAAGDRPVVELDAAQAAPGMTVWTGNRFLTVADVYRDGSTVELAYSPPSGTAARWLCYDAPVYRLDTSGHQWTPLEAS